MKSALNPLFLFATLFYLGRIKYLGSILATFLAIPLAWAIISYLGVTAFILITIATFVVGVLAAEIYVRSAGGADDVVIDEVVGMWLVLVIAIKLGYPLVFPVYLAAVISFLIFDLSKPWPIIPTEEKIGGGLGIMIDDVLASLYGFLGMASMLFFYKYVLVGQ